MSTHTTRARRVWVLGAAISLSHSGTNLCLRYRIRVWVQNRTSDDGSCTEARRGGHVEENVAQTVARVCPGARDHAGVKGPHKVSMPAALRAHPQEAGAATCRRRCRCGSAAQDLAAVATLLVALAVRPSGAGRERLPDGTPMLVAPWTDADFVCPTTNPPTTCPCPTSDGRICPILTLNNPEPAVSIKSQEYTVLMRDVVPVSPEEIALGATVPFFIYDYKWDHELQVRRYMNHTGLETIKISFNYTMGRAWYAYADAQDCDVIVQADTPGALFAEATLETGALSFSITDTIPKINCFLASVRFSKAGGEISSEMQLAQFGGMSTLEIFMQTALSTKNYDSAYKVKTVIFYDSIMIQPRILSCPSFSYPYPSSVQLPGSSVIPQPISIPNWDRTQLAPAMGGQCWTTPMAAYPDQLPVGTLACPKTHYQATWLMAPMCLAPGGSCVAPTCKPCSVTKDTWLYVFEDSPTTMTLSDIAFEDGAFFYGSVEMKMELVFDRFDPDSQDTNAVLTAQPGRESEFDYCAHTSVAASRCATRSEDAFSRSWVPPETTKWGKDYTIRIVEYTDNAVMCEPGTRDCPSVKTAGSPSTCEDPGDPDEFSAKTWCPCKTGLCYTVNSKRRARSRVINPTEGRVRLWWEIRDQQGLGSVVQTGYIDLRLVGDVAGGMFYSYPPSLGGKLNWFIFSPMKISGTYDRALKRLTLTKLMTDASLHPKLNITIDSRFGLMNFPNVHENVFVRPEGHAGSQGQQLSPARRVAMEGSLRELTISLSLMQYQVNHALYPHLNTQIKGRAESEHLKLIYDKTLATQGAFDPGGMGAVTVFDMPVAILATNDAPRITIPNLHSTAENALSHVRGVSLNDMDAQEVFVGSADAMPSGDCPTRPGEAHNALQLTLSTNNGTHSQKYSLY